MATTIKVICDCCNTITMTDKNYREFRKITISKFGHIPTLNNTQGLVVTENEQLMCGECFRKYAERNGDL